MTQPQTTNNQHMIGSFSLQSDPHLLPTTPGTYILLLRATEPITLRVGRLGTHSIATGWLAYVGSALGPGGLDARIGRHLRYPKSIHWHIDTLTSLVPVTTIWYRANNERLECAWAATITRHDEVTIPVMGFGASDCRCHAHLFALSEAAIPVVWQALEQPDMLSLPLPQTAGDQRLGVTRNSNDLPNINDV